MSTGILVTVGLFALLWRLVDTPYLGKPVPAIPFNFTRLAELPPIAAPVRPPKPEIDKPILPPGPTGFDFDDPKTVRPQPNERTGPWVFRSEIPFDTPAVGVDRDPLPIVRVDPDYPQRAVNGEIEGWVDVQFSVTATGAVRDVVIIDSNPKNIFDAAVIKAVGRWRYNPKVDHGVAVERIGMRTRIVFELDRE
jgi:protein TonB